ncbi:uncharacterized protein PHALS_12818 [Plasmopara halstedii]|uniref:Uncharacterized protein n=1 Tax=Plasmopara halstedii TaxID=4781 RepID=A0A0P1AN75_PLAHL|nr:uncharacterized protein PHALS_12818 [Plasmopara halstedii]CEG42553.1 hypothetical protein PHALS_12818 [Plasmopara halstedii]|eukprot:XP_024578922.1 hypothetical protein PHALS_12818 [Plasmopara halstedii]
MPPDVVKRYSLFQRSVRLIQTSIRRLDRWAASRVPGLPNPPEVEERLRKPRFIDLWELTFDDHRRIFHEVWQEYKASFSGPSDEELDRSKDEIKRAVQIVRGQVSSTVNKNLSFLDKSLEGTKAHNNLHTLGKQGAENVQYLAKEIKDVAKGVDTDAVIAHAKQVVEDSRSKDDMATTLKKNVIELRNLAKEGRDAALRLDGKDVDTFKLSVQSWFADKLLVGQSVLMAFINGYREGKALEIEREDALLITFAKQAAEDHKDLIENQVKKIMDQQREKQRQEQEKAASEASQNTGHSELKAESIEMEKESGKSSAAGQSLSAHHSEPLTGRLSSTSNKT